MMHDVMMTHKNKRTNKYKKGIFLGRYSTVANFLSVRNQGLSNPGKSQTPEGDAR
jgi:hypothetical protein